MKDVKVTLPAHDGIINLILWVLGLDEDKYDVVDIIWTQDYIEADPGEYTFDDVQTANTEEGLRGALKEKTGARTMLFGRLVQALRLVMPTTPICECGQYGIEYTNGAYRILPTDSACVHCGRLVRAPELETEILCWVTGQMVSVADTRYRDKSNLLVPRLEKDLRQLLDREGGVSRRVEEVIRTEGVQLILWLNAALNAPNGLTSLGGDHRQLLNLVVNPNPGFLLTENMATSIARLAKSGPYRRGAVAAVDTAKAQPVAPNANAGEQNGFDRLVAKAIEEYPGNTVLRSWNGMKANQRIPNPLLNVLAELYGSRDRVQYLCYRAGLKTTWIPSASNPIQLWTEIWSHFERGGVA